MASKLILLLLQISIVLGQDMPPALLSPPPSSMYRALSAGTVYFDADLTFFCKSDGDSLTYNWFLNGKELDKNANNVKWEEDKGHLTIVAPVEGYYQCKVTKFKHGVAISNVSRVIITKLVVPEAGETVFQVNKGGALTMPCNTREAVIIPSANYDWQKTANRQSPDFRRVETDARIQIDSDGGLNFAYVEADDHAGGYFYRCHLVNSLDNSKLRSTSYSKITLGTSTENPTQLKLMFSTPVVYALVGQKIAHLRCFFAGAINTVIVWTYKGELKKSGRFKPSVSTLEISDVQQEDEGEYTCRGETSGLPAFSAKVNLIVNAIPTFTNGPSNMNASVDDSVTMSCKTNANPPATLTWYRNGTELKADSLPPNLSINKVEQTLTVNNLCKDCGDERDIAVIQCLAENTNGSLLGQGYINIYAKTIITKSPEDVILKDQPMVNFSCLATTDPNTKLTYTWKLNNQVVSNGLVNTAIPGHVFINIQNSTDKGQQFRGTWTCVLTNGISTVEASANLGIYSEPASVLIPLIILFCLLFIILLIIIILCCIYYNRGDMYPVDQKERWGGNNPEKELIESGFHDYQRPLMFNEHRPSYSE